MPMARMASSEPLSRMVIRKPDNTEFPAVSEPSVMAKNPGSAIRLNTTSISRAISGIKHWFFMSFITKLGLLDVLTPLFILIVTSCYRVHYFILVQILSGQLAHHFPVPHHHEPGTGAEHLIQFRGNKCHAHTLRSKLEH